jgi:benzoate membrane transport protein
LVSAIPGALANAMLAGVLFGLCLAPIRALVDAPVAASAIVLVWLAVSRWKRILATPIAALAAGGIIAFDGGGAGLDFSALMPRPIFVTPAVSVAGIVSLSLPLFVVTMASQNLPGLAVLNAYGFRPKPGPLVAITGLFTILAAPFGGHAVNLSAITAALCASPDASPEPGRRWIAAVTAGATYIVFGLLASWVTAFAAGAPILVEAVAGLALLGAFGSALHNALAETVERESALITFLVTASGVSVYGTGGAFWGLVAGGCVLLLTRAGPLTPR